MFVNHLMIVFAQQSINGFTLEGPHGVISAWPDNTGTYEGEEQTYWVEARYFQHGERRESHSIQRGFRLSTVWCLCAGICEGDDYLNMQMVNDVNALFKAA